MTLKPAQIVVEIERQGGRLTVTQAGRLKYKTPPALEALLEPLRAHREEVTEYLRQRQSVSIGQAVEILGDPRVTPDVPRPCSHCRAGKLRCRCDFCKLQGHCAVCQGAERITTKEPAFDPNDPGHVAYRAGRPITVPCPYCEAIQASRKALQRLPRAGGLALRRPEAYAACRSRTPSRAPTSWAARMESRSGICAPATTPTELWPAA